MMEFSKSKNCKIGPRVSSARRNSKSRPGHKLITRVFPYAHWARHPQGARLLEKLYDLRPKNSEQASTMLKWVLTERLGSEPERKNFQESNYRLQ